MRRIRKQHIFEIGDVRPGPHGQCKEVDDFLCPAAVQMCSQNAIRAFLAQTLNAEYFSPTRREEYQSEAFKQAPKFRVKKEMISDFCRADKNLFRVASRQLTRSAEGPRIVDCHLPASKASPPRRYR